jgi:hypothetical protein
VSKRQTRIGKRAVDESVEAFLSELARYLVAAGITNSRFTGISQVAFFRAASDQARFGNERLNQSAVAAMTGLTRLQVRQFAKQARPSPTKTRDRLENVIEGWTQDPTFTTPDRSPRQLRVIGKGRTFEALVRRYGGDVPARSLLRELQRQGYVSQRDGRVSLTRVASETRDETRLRRTSRALIELLKASEGLVGAQSLPRALNMEVTYPATSDKGRVLLNRRTAENMRTFMTGVHAAGLAAATDSPPSAKQKGTVTRTRVVLISEEFGK